MNYIDEFNVKEKSKGSWLEISYSNIVVMLCLWLAFFLSPISLALLVLVYVYLEAGIHNFVLGRIRKNSLDYESLFLPLKQYPKLFALKLVYTASILLWSLLLLIPGVIVALNYAFVLLVYLDNPDLPIREILVRSRKLMSGNRGKILLIALVSLIFVCIGASIGFGINALINLAVKVPVYATVILTVFFGGLLGTTISLPLYETYLASCYETALAKETELKSEKPGKKVVKRN